MNTATSVSNLFACPVCKEPKLVSESADIYCPTCHHRYPIVQVGEDRIIDFIPDADAPFQNPVQKLWTYLLGTQTESQEYNVAHNQPFEGTDIIHTHFEVEGELILDIGGGSGYLRRYLKPGQMYVCIEPDPKAFARRLVFAKFDSRLGDRIISYAGLPNTCRLRHHLSTRFTWVV